jgi:hypothetical protein
VNATNLTGEALVEAHKSATRKLRIISILFPIVFIGFLLFNLKGVVDQIADIDSAEVGSQLADRVNALMPDIQHSLGDLAETAKPALSAAMETEALEMAPQIERRLQSDVDVVMKNAKSDLAVAARASMATGAATQRALIVKEFPQLAGDTAAQDKLLASASEALVQWEQRQLDATVTEHLVAMEQLHKTLQTSYSKSANEEADPEDALMTWLNLLNQHVGGEDHILTGDTKTAAAKPAAGAATAAKK